MIIKRLLLVQHGIKQIRVFYSAGKVESRQFYDPSKVTRFLGDPTGMKVFRQIHRSSTHPHACIWFDIVTQHDTEFRANQTRTKWTIYLPSYVLSYKDESKCLFKIAGVFLSSGVVDFKSKLYFNFKNWRTSQIYLLTRFLWIKSYLISSLIQIFYPIKNTIYLQLRPPATTWKNKNPGGNSWSWWARWCSKYPQIVAVSVATQKNLHSIPR